MHVQEQLASLTELRQLIVHAARPLYDEEAQVKLRLPMLEVAYRTHHGTITTVTATCECFCQLLCALAHLV